MVRSEAMKRSNKKYQTNHREEISENERFRKYRTYVCKDDSKQFWKNLLIMNTEIFKIKLS